MISSKTWLVGVFLLFGQGVHAADDAQSLLDRVRATYAALNSYRDSGAVVAEFGPAAAPSKEQHSFSTEFLRAPRRFLFDFHKSNNDRLVIWGDPDAFHTWWKATAVTADYANPNNAPAINLSDFPTLGAATKIAVLLYPKAPLFGTLSHITDLVSQPSESIAGHDCLRLSGQASDRYGNTGNSVNRRSITIWIDKASLLIRQLREESQATGGQVNRTTTNFEPMANPAMEERTFRFQPPATS